MAELAASMSRRLPDASRSVGILREGNNYNARPVQKSQSSCINGGSNKLYPGARGFLVILDRGVDKSAKVNEVCEIFEKFPPDSFEQAQTADGNRKSSIAETELLINGNWGLKNTKVKVGGNQQALSKRSHGGEVLGDGEHNVEDLSSTTQLDKTKSTADDEKFQRRRSQLTKSSSSLKNMMEAQENEFEGALSSLKKPGEAEDDFIKRIVREEMEKYLNDDALLGAPAPPKYSGSGEELYSTANSSSSTCGLRRDENEFNDTVFIPKLTRKPNAVKRLELKPIMDPKTRREYYEHPYKEEINRWTPSPSLLHRSDTEWNFRKVNEAPTNVIHSYGRLEMMIRELRGLKELAFGVKYSQLSYFGSCCLLMITTRYKNYVIDTFNLKKHLESLNEFFTDPAILKVGHDVSEGLLYLQKDLGIYVVGLLDTNEAEKIIRKTTKQTSLACILRKYFHDCLDSTYRDVEWSIRPLPKHMITYARTETHYLLRIYDLQKAELLSRGAGEHLYQAFENSKHLCLSRYEKPDRDYWVQKYKAQLNNQQFYALSELNSLRNAKAMAADKCPQLLCSDKSLVELAKALPLTWVEVKDLKQMRKVFLSSLMERQKENMVRIFEEARMLRLVNPQIVKRHVVGRPIKTGVSNFMFLESKVLPQAEVVRKIIDFYREHIFAVPNFVNRILPVDTTCEKTMPCIQATLAKLLASVTVINSLTYEVVSNFPYTKQHSLIAGVTEVVQDVKPDWLYSEDSRADIAIIAYAVREMCCLSVVKGYTEYQGFYLRHPAPADIRND